MEQELWAGQPCGPVLQTCCVGFSVGADVNAGVGLRSGVGEGASEGACVGGDGVG